MDVEKPLPFTIAFRVPDDVDVEGFPREPIVSKRIEFNDIIDKRIANPGVVVTEGPISEPGRRLSPNDLARITRVHASRLVEFNLADPKDCVALARLVGAYGLVINQEDAERCLVVTFAGVVEADGIEEI